MTGKQHQTVETAGEPSSTTTTPETTMTTETTTETSETSSSTRPTITRHDRKESTSTEEHSQRTVDPLSTTCDECGNEDLTRNDKHGEITCDDCGTIVENINFPQTAGWKRHSITTHSTNTSVTDNNDSGISMSPLGGTIDWKDMDGYGSSLSSKKRARMHRLRQLDQSLDSGNAKTSNYKYALGEINRIAAGLALPRYIRDSATSMYEQLLEDDALRGHSIEPVATAVLYAACEDKNVTRDLEEVAALSHADYTEIADTYESLLTTLGLNDQGVEITTHVGSFCNELNLDGDVKSIASDILENTLTEEMMEDATLMEHTAAAIYAASVRTGTILSQERLADAADLSTDAIRARYQQHIEAAAFNTAY